MRPGRKWQRWSLIGGGFVLVGVLGMGVGLGTGWRDPWPARLVIRLPQPTSIVGIIGDGRWLVINDHQRDWIYADLKTGQLRPAPSQRMIIGRNYSRDGQRFVGVDHEGGICSGLAWGETTTETIWGQFATDPLWVAYPSFEPGERSIRAFVGPKGQNQITEVVTWDLASGAETRRPFNGPSGLEPGAAVEVASLDRRVLVFHEPVRNQIRLWDSVTDSPLGGPIPAPDRGPSNWSGIAELISLSADRRTLALARAGGQVEVWDVTPTESRLVRTLVVHSPGFRTDDVVLAPDGRTLASSGILATGRIAWYRRAWANLNSRSDQARRETNHEVVVTDVATGRPVRRLRGALHPRFTPDGRTILTREAEGVHAVRDVPEPGGR